MRAEELEAMRKTETSAWRPEGGSHAANPKRPAVGEEPISQKGIPLSTCKQGHLHRFIAWLFPSTLYGCKPFCKNSAPWNQEKVDIHQPLAFRNVGAKR